MELYTRLGFAGETAVWGSGRPITDAYPVEILRRIRDGIEGLPIAEESGPVATFITWSQEVGPFKVLCSASVGALNPNTQITVFGPDVVDLEGFIGERFVEWELEAVEDERPPDPILLGVFESLRIIYAHL